MYYRYILNLVVIMHNIIYGIRARGSGGSPGPNDVGSGVMRDDYLPVAKAGRVR